MRFWRQPCMSYQEVSREQLGLYVRKPKPDVPGGARSWFHGRLRPQQPRPSWVTWAVSFSNAEMPPQAARDPPRARRRRQPAACVRLRRHPHLRPSLALDRPAQICPGSSPSTSLRGCARPLVERLGQHGLLDCRPGRPSPPPLRCRRQRTRSHGPIPQPPPELKFTTRQVPWARSVPLDSHLANLASYSDFLVLGEKATKALLAAERDLLTGTFPSGTVEERYVASLAVARC